MKEESNMAKAIVHISGTQLRRVWYGKERQNVVVVRPSGTEGETTAYLVNQVKFNGPSELVFAAKQRENGEGWVGTLPGFDGAVLAYMTADEKDILVQANDGDEYVALAEFRKGLAAGRFKAPTINPRLADGC
jgi:hypothetical protein